MHTLPKNVSHKIQSSKYEITIDLSLQDFMMLLAVYSFSCLETTGLIQFTIQLWLVRTLSFKIVLTYERVDRSHVCLLKSVCCNFSLAEQSGSKDWLFGFPAARIPLTGLSYEVIKLCFSVFLSIFLFFLSFFSYFSSLCI